MIRSLDPSPVPAAAYMLADHLDAALASGEDILAVGQRTKVDVSSHPGQQVALRSGVELIRSLELAMITRVLKAREWSKALDKADSRFRTIGSLFQSGTNALVDALAEFADATEADFETGDGITAYFRSRGMIDAEAPALADGPAALVTETFRLTGRIELGALLNLIASYLDALEDHFVIFGESERPASITSPAQAACATA